MDAWRRDSPSLCKKNLVHAVQGGNRGGNRHKRGSGGRLLEPSCELEVLKCIMLREGYLARVARLVEDMTRRAKRSHGQVALPAGMIDLLDLLRIATLETVEAISLWRLSQVTPTPAPFEWNGHNYLMKMLQDCSFLDRVDALRSWLGFEASGNPFLLPQQACAGMDPDSSGLSTGKKRDPKFGFDKPGLADVGTQPWLGPLKVDLAEESGDQGAGKGGARPKKRRVQKTGVRSSVAPYAAAVVNDPTLLPAVKAPTPSGLSSPGPPGQKKGPGTDAPPGQAVVDIESLVPNLVTREDVQRMCAAGQALLEEQMRVTEAGKASQEAESARDGRNVSRASVSSSCGSPNKRRTSHFGQPPRRNGSSVGAFQFHSRTPSTSQDSAGDTRSIVLTTARLWHQPRPEPHPGLGPVVLQSDRLGGELRPNPFLHTVSDAHSAQTDDLEAQITIRTPNKVEENKHFWNRCSTAPLATTGGSPRGRETSTQDDLGRPSVNHRRAATAPEKMPDTSSIRSPSFSGQETPPSSTLQRPEEQGKPTCQQSFPGPATSNLEEGKHPHPASSKYSPRGQGRSRKVGAELRVLTAAGTAGRRQPPPREARLRRLARDVARHSAELRRLVGEEKQLRKGLACRSGDDEQAGGVEACGELEEGEAGPGTTEDSSDAVAMMVAIRRDDGAARRVRFSDEEGTLREYPTKKMEALLEDKRREIKLKTFDLAVKRDELRCLRMVQKQERQRRLALEMERRRAHLDDGQGLPEDNKVAESLEGSSCLLIQKRFRGNVGREFAAWYKGRIQQDATTIQRGVRFIWDRRATRRRLLVNASARPMQAAIRMFIKRQQYKRLLRQRREFFAASKLQVVIRGMLGRRRAAARRAMIAASTRALGWVSLERLQPGHLKELARAIHGALVDPVRQFPPAGVLGALRVALTILDDASERTNTTGVDAIGSGCGGSNDEDMVTFETALGRTVRAAVSAPDLTWEMAARVLERPFRLLRRMRAFASGLGAASDSTPVRLLHLSPKAAALLSAYRGDPSWSSEALSAMTEGGVAAKAFVGWAVELEKVYREQPCVEAFLRDAQPAWLRKARSFQKRRRALELHAEACRQAVSVAREHRRRLKSRGLAYGAPAVAMEVLQNQAREAVEAVRQLECRRSAFLAAQAKVEEDAGRVLREDVEFAEREASVAGREEEMALRLGQSGPEELEALAGKVRDCGVVVRELRRRLSMWERRCREEKRPLLDEWVPPTEGQARMSRALGEAQAWQQITAAQKARLVEAAGGRRFVKGLSGKDLETWRGAVENLAACGADVEAGEARLVEDVDRFEREISRANAEIAAEKVRFAPWDNATADTQQLEHQEDAAAARDERRTAMGATLPPGMLENASSRQGAGGSGGAGGPSRRPTLLLLGLDLPASIRDGIRAGLDRGAPGLFGGHVVGADALPSLASTAAQPAAGGGRGFFGRCRELGVQAATAAPPPIGSRAEEEDAPPPMPGAPAAAAATPGRRSEHGRDDELVGSEGGASEGGTTTAAAAARARARLLQATLSAGKDVSLEVVPGPGLWARGRFLRDLEALLGGLDECGGCGGEDPDAGVTDGGKKYSGPTVLLVDGHNRNRSGGGIELSHGTKFMGKTAAAASHRNGCVGESRFKAEELARGMMRRREPGQAALSATSSATRRVKALMEEAAQCLHDLGTTHGEAPSPFKVIQTAEVTPPTPRSLREEGDDEPEAGSEAEARRMLPNTLPAGGGTATTALGHHPNASYLGSGAQGYSPGMELLLAACHMILHPDQRYDVGEGQFIIGGTRITGSSGKNASEKHATTTELSRTTDAEKANAAAAATLVYASRLAAACRAELAEKPSARGVAETLRGAAASSLDAMPLGTAVALRRLARHPDWPAASPRPALTGCPASGAFVGWIYAAVAGATELALEGGGGTVQVCSDRGPVPERGAAMDDWSEEGQGTCGGGLETGSALKGGGSDPQVVSALSPRGVDEERWREREALREMEAALIDENVTVVDDDSPWSLDGSGDGRDRRQCRTSELLSALMEAALSRFKVFEEPDRQIPSSTSSSPQPSGVTGNSRQPVPQVEEEEGRFRVTVSRAFGYVYARAVSLGSGRMRKGQAAMTRTREEDLIQLLSSNWMEKHDLSALRELRTEPAVWRALVHTLVLRYPDDGPPGPIPTTTESHTRLLESSSSNPPSALAVTSATATAAAAANQADDELAAAPGAAPDTASPSPSSLPSPSPSPSPSLSPSKKMPPRGTTQSRSGGDRGRVGGEEAVAVLSFRHDRRLTLKTSCLLMGRAVPVSVYEESRSDFWCEAEIPADLTLTSRGKGKTGAAASCPVGLRVPKECIPLILDDGHPMRMRAILDASDLRHLSVLIADRLKLCRVGSSTPKGPRSYRYWLDAAIGSGGGGSSRPGGSEGSTARAAAAAAAAAAGGSADGPGQRHDDQSRREFKLSLRKRSIGQVVFSRVVSFWEPPSAPSAAVPAVPPEINKGGFSRRRSPRASSAGRLVAQRLVVVKEFAHRGECGELRGEVHHPDCAGEMGTFAPAPELTRMLLGGWLAEMKKAADRDNNACARYWRDALTWRLRMEPVLSCHGIDGEEETERFLRGVERVSPTPSTGRDDDNDSASRLTVDERKPLLTLRRVVAATSEQTPSSSGEGEGSGGISLAAPTAHFDVMLLLPQRQEPTSSMTPSSSRNRGIDLVATHRQTMTAFSFSVAAKPFVKEIDAIVAACLTAPTALSTELELPAPNTVLRGLAAKWLRFSPGDARSGRSPTLTLSLPRTRPIVAEPYVSLRCCGGKGKGKHYRTTLAEAKDAATAVAAEVGPTMPDEGYEEPDRSRRRSRRTPGSVPGGSNPTGTRSRSIASLQVETRNERMVFRGSLAVPRLGDVVAVPGREASAGVKELGAKVLAVSVYEAFTAGSAGRTERHLRFCARDENVRPVVEAATTIPWVGTCEGIEGGKLWRVLTGALGVECSRDEKGKCVGMRLAVATEGLSEGRLDSCHTVAQPGRRESSPPAALPLLEGVGRDGTEPEVAAGGRRGTHDDDNKPRLVGVNQNSGEEEVKTGLSGRALDDIGGVNAPRRLQDDANKADGAVVDPQEQKQDGLEPPVDDVRRHTPDPPKETPEDPGLVFHGGGNLTAHQAATKKVYSGWHRVTGIRLHVQCFQDSNDSSAGGDLADFASVTRVTTPAGRGGAIGLPRDASLRFLVCDPSTGHRRGIMLSVDEVCRNLSVDGGIVEAGLLDAGRRPALAKAIAEKLRLVFEAGGGYRVVLPLPAKWNRAWQQAG